MLLVHRPRFVEETTSPLVHLGEGGTTLAKQQQGKDTRFSSEDKHEHGDGFLVYKDIGNTVVGCRPVPSRLITIRLRAVPFSITIVQPYAATSD